MKRQLLFFWTILYATTLYAGHRLQQLTVSDGLPNPQIRQIIQLPDRQVLVATEGAFSLYNGSRFVNVPCNLDSVRPLPAFGGHDYCWQGDSLLWLKDFYSVYLFDVRRKQFRYDYDRQQSLSPHFRRFVNERADSLSSRHKAFISRHAKVFEREVNDVALTNEPLQAYLEDYQGGQWFGLRSGGIYYLPPASTSVKLIDMGVDDVPRRMVAVGANVMLVGGEKGIYLYDCVHDTVERVLLLDDVSTTEISTDAFGKVWISTKLGLYIYQNGALQHYGPGDVTGMRDAFVRFALPLDDRRLLVCNAMHDLAYFYPEERRMHVLNKQLPALNAFRTMVVATALDHRHQVAVCTQNGFFVLDTAVDTLSRLPAVQRAAAYCKKYNCILRDRIGRLWVGTQNGLLLVEGDKLRRFSRLDGLSNECIESLAEDAAGNIWVATSGGVNRLSCDDGSAAIHIRPIGAGDGLPDVEMTERGSCMMPDGTLYLATTIGLVRLVTRAFQNKADVLPVVLVGLEVAGNPMPLDTLPLRLLHHQNDIDLEVSALNYAGPGQVRYRYRLLSSRSDGGRGWVLVADDGRLATIRLTGLSPGRYLFEAQASMGDDRWGPPLRKRFVIRPPLWLSGWALMLYAVVVLAVAYLLLRWYVGYRQEKLQREHEMRINQLFALREEASQRFAQSVEIQPEDIARDSRYHPLVQSVTKAVGANLDNSAYTVDLLARDVGMSRASLYKKLQEVLGITPNDFIRDMRLKHAADLLAKSEAPVSEISLMVGFQTPRYFSQCFRKMFGVTPSEYREGKSR